MIAVSTSRLAAASLPVTSPIRRGRRGSGRLRSAREEALGGELPLQALERGEMVAEAEALDREGPQAEVARGLEQLGPPEDVDALAVREVEPQRVELAAGHRHAEAGAVGRVLQREEDALPALLAAELGHLALDPDRRQAREPVADAAVEGRHREDLPVAVLDRLDLHARMLRPRPRLVVTGARRAARPCVNCSPSGRVACASPRYARRGWRVEASPPGWGAARASTAGSRPRSAARSPS